jgi:hypothetical protein
LKIGGILTIQPNLFHESQAAGGLERVLLHFIGNPVHRRTICAPAKNKSAGSKLEGNVGANASRKGERG